MKALLISNFNMEEGRGPMFRMRNMIPYLNRYCKIHLLTLGEMDKTLQKDFNELNIVLHSTKYLTNGWFVKNCTEIAKEAERISIANSIDIIVLAWEIWDIAIELYKNLHDKNIFFAVVMHSIPFAASTLKTTNFLFDSFIRLINSKRMMIRKYIICRFIGASSYMKKLNIIVTSKTVEKKLYKYFPDLKLYLSYPGYACETGHQISNKEFLYDCAFMAIFEQEKGIFELIEIMKTVKKFIANIKIVLIGSFTFDDENIKFKKLITKYGLNNNVFIAGWKMGEEKYNLIRKSKIFIYPSSTGDTFSQSILEALSCGKKIICYDVPFTRDNFNLNTVVKVPVFNNKLFAFEIISALKDKNFYYEESEEFVKNRYSSWDKVARAEYECYKKITFCK